MGFRSWTLALTLLAAGCGPSSDNGTTVVVTPVDSPGRMKNKPLPPPPESTKVTSLVVDVENLNIDKISMRDGGIHPDGNRDFVFRATVEGPADALYLVTVDGKGIPQYGFRADTIVGHEEIPPELGSAIDVGRLTVWIAVVESGHFINSDSGTLGNLAAGTHQLKLYVPNTGNLQPGAHLRLYARAPNGGLAKGPVVPY